MSMLYAIVVTFLLLVSIEWLWRYREFHNEYTRKFVHMLVGTFVAFWPFYMTWQQIRLVSVAFAIVVAISIKFQIFKSIHSVERPTWGEVLFAVAVGLTTYITHEPFVYAIAILHMSLADGAAAIFGTKYGKANSYRVLGMHKSVAGTLTFMAVSFVLLTIFVVGSGMYVNTAYVALIALAATAIENIGWRGFDNLLVPMVVAAGLRILG